VQSSKASERDRKFLRKEFCLETGFRLMTSSLGISSLPASPANFRLAIFHTLSLNTHPIGSDSLENPTTSIQSLSPCAWLGEDLTVEEEEVVSHERKETKSR
jgi:hypothetical protein